MNFASFNTKDQSELRVWGKYLWMSLQRFEGPITKELYGFITLRGHQGDDLEAFSNIRFECMCVLF